ncbi:MAG: glycolate oxidase subunit GlcF [Alphaproteobacteria bacterium]
MQTHFTPEQLADPDNRESEKILRACVHCGFCTATCPTYVLLGDELDSPRGRIYLMKEMLEKGGRPTDETVKHVDRCLSCLSCMTTCPSGVHYQHLVDHGRTYIEANYRRPVADRLLRGMLATVLPRPLLARLAFMGAWFARPLAPVLPARLAAMLRLAPRSLAAPSPDDRPQVFPAEGERRMRVALLAGCVQQVVAPGINEATIRLLTRHGAEVVVVRGAGCCGALPHHLGKERPSHRLARANIAAWLREAEGEGLDAVVANASGCGTQVKDYGFMFRDDPDWAGRAARVSALARDVTEVMATLGIGAPLPFAKPVLAYHSACSMQHGQGIRTEPVALLQAAGFEVRTVPEGHLCCGSAGTYNLLQPELATRLRDRKVANIARTGAGAVATGNVGCISQIAAGADMPVLHTVELLDWATGGPKPAVLPSGRQRP